jgi:hypothetical protein
MSPDNYRIHASKYTGGRAVAQVELFAGFLPRLPGFNPCSHQVGLVGQVFSNYFGFSFQLFHQSLGLSPIHSQDRRSVGQSVLVSCLYLEPKIRFLLLSYICGYIDVKRPLWLGGQVCRLQLLLAFTSAVILGSESRGTCDRLLRLRFETPPTWGARSPYLYIYPRNRVVQLYPPALGCIFVIAYVSQGYDEGILSGSVTYPVGRSY